MEDNTTIASSKPHCLVLAFPAQGHINPMIQFSKLLIHEGVKVTLCTTRSFINKLQNLPSSMSIESISDGFDNGFEGTSPKAYVEKLLQVGPQTLVELLENLSQLGYPIDCIIYDSFMPWVLDVAKKHGIFGASYLTQNLCVNSIYYHYQLGKIKVPINDEDEILLPFMPKLQKGDLPSFFFTCEEEPTQLKFLVDQFSNIDKADWILCNSIYELDKEIAEWTTKIWPKFRTIGPNIPSMVLDNRIKNDQVYDVAQFKIEDYCIDWLDNKPKFSVTYVSFGSMVPLNEEQMEEIAYGLRDSNNYFLWVVRASEENKLPKDFAKKSEKGLIVTWCSQLKVLQHEAIACFVTHCGWNSTLETLSIGVPTIAMPQWSDQATNAKYIVDVWKVGIRAPFYDDKKKIVKRDALKKCIVEMVDGEKGNEIRKNAIQLRKLILEAASVGGSSHTNILEFVKSL